MAQTTRPKRPRFTYAQLTKLELALRVVHRLDPEKELDQDDLRRVQAKLDAADLALATKKIEAAAKGEAHGAFIPRWCIEGTHRRMQESPLPVGVNAAPILVVIHIRLVLAARKVQMLIVTRRLIGAHTAPTDLRIE